MPVNTAALKTFAPAMRRQLLEAVGRKLDLLLNSQTPDTLSTYARQIAELREQEAENRDQLLERVAYTWFNRLCALRYLDARGWHPFGCKVLMPAGEGETQPELLKLMRAGSLPVELKLLTNESRLHGLLDGQIPTAITGADPQGEVYRELVLASCRSYHELLPNLFEGLDDVTELLLPDDLLTEGSIAGGFRREISDEDCQDVEIIGWLYQFYISEKKDQVIGKVVKSEDIPAATQLFTPNWIVKYMVQNTLGGLWLATYPDSPLKEEMEYYIEPSAQTVEARAQLNVITPASINPEELTLLDPACGSGHILVEAYEVFKKIYLELGYPAREAARLVLEKNLYGFDIDERATQLTTFALTMKGREDDRRALERRIKLNVITLVDSDRFDAHGLADAASLAKYGLRQEDLTEIKRVFESSATFGALIVPPKWLIEKLPALHLLVEANEVLPLASEPLKQLEKLSRQSLLLASRYDVVVANPPYIGSKFHIASLKKFLKDNYYGYEKDVFSAFIDRGLLFSKPRGRLGFMSPFVWMFISSHEHLRSRLIGMELITTLVQLEYSGFEGATVPICTFTLQKTQVSGYRGTYIRLSDFRGANNQAPKVLEAIKDRECGWIFNADQSDFKKIPGSPLAYWVGENIKRLFSSSPRLASLSEPRRGLQPGNTPKHVRIWQEVSLSKASFSVVPEEVESITKVTKWIGFTSGGDFRKWAGNLLYVVNWENSGYEIKHGHNPIVPNENLYFQEAITWSKVSSSAPSFRRHPKGLIPGDAGPFAIVQHGKYESVFASLNAAHTLCFLKILSPTLNFQVGDVGNVPILDEPLAADNVNVLISLAQADWDAFERSWGFRSIPLLGGVPANGLTLESSYESWIAQNRETVVEMKRLEEENNLLFINAYGLQGEVLPEVPIEQITLTINPAYRYGSSLTEEEQSARFQRDTMAEFLSYATGCMMGRYSLDDTGLILADSRDSQAAHLAAYEAKVGKPLSAVQFKPDPDAIIPVLDGEWFEDDIVARTREFLEVTFPESTVTENLRFIEESLGKDIRKYFCTDFYKDHLQTYKKRPIYWMVQSPKKGFTCLIYLHRYTQDTLLQVLNNYFRPYLQKLEARLAQLGLDQLNESLPTRERTAARKEADKITKVLKECQAWEQDALLPLAQQRIELDLDDGVKVNYLKLKDVLAPIPGLAAKGD